MKTSRRKPLLLIALAWGLYVHYRYEGEWRFEKRFDDHAACVATAKALNAETRCVEMTLAWRVLPRIVWGEVVVGFEWFPTADECGAYFQKHGLPPRVRCEGQWRPVSDQDLVDLAKKTEPLALPPGEKRYERLRTRCPLGDPC